MNSIFTEENLLAFTTAARFGSFSKAADELGLTTSAISYTIKELTQENISYTSDQGKTYDFNTADKLNTLLINALVSTIV